MEKYYEEALRLHKTYPVVDTHLDLAAEIYYRRRNGEREVIRRHYLEPLNMEGLDVITWDLSILKCFYDMGVRGASLTWSRRNYLGEGCCKASEYRQIPGGLSELGKETVRQLEALHMFVDVSHLNDDGFADLAGIASKPFIASHSNARTVHDNYRNLTDEQIRQLSDRGGIMGMNACSGIVGAAPGLAGISKMCDHIEYIIRLVGPEHVGIGLDLCDAYYAARAKRELSAQRDDCLKDHSELILLTAELLRRGIREEDIVKILGGNFLRYFCSVLD